MEALDNQLRHMVYGMEQGKRELDEALARAHEVERGLDRAMMGKCFFSYLSGAAWPSSPAPPRWDDSPVSDYKRRSH